MLRYRTDITDTMEPSDIECKRSFQKFIDSNSVPETEEHGFFSILPNELLCMVFSFIRQDKTFARMNQVNKAWNHFATVAWRQFCFERSLLDDEEFWKKHGKTWTWLIQAQQRDMKDQKSGVGYLIFGEKQRYEGDIVNNKRSGWGREITNGNVYKGCWNDDMKEGNGELILHTGAKYVGSWKNNKKNGYGSYTFPNGDHYEGDWKDDMKDGPGLYTFGKGKWEGDRYQGEWKENKKWGKGVYTWKDGDKYEGEFEEDNFSGYGTYFFACGDKYSGNWKSDKRCGYGVYEYSHGGKFEGQFKDGKRNGKGTLFWSNGDQFVGEWHFGSRRGPGVFFNASTGAHENQTWNEAPDANYSTVQPARYPTILAVAANPATPTFPTTNM